MKEEEQTQRIIEGQKWIINMKQDIIESQRNQINRLEEELNHLRKVIRLLDTELAKIDNGKPSFTHEYA